MVRRERAQSEVLGTVFLLGITVAAVTITVATGSVALAAVTDDARSSGVENGMSQLTSQASLVALGEADAKRFDLGSIDGGDLRLDEDAGRVDIRVEGSNGTIENESFSLGTLVYTGDRREVAIQGGGVWSLEGDRGRMISPPEYHYRGETLTFPIVRLTGDETSPNRGTGVVRRSNVSKVLEDVENPLQNGTVVVEVESDYYEGWYDFFTQRADGDVTKDDENRTATARLTVPDEVSLDKSLALGSDDTDMNIPLHEDEYELGVSNPSPSAVIEDRIDTAAEEGEPVSECFDSGSCTAGTYHGDGDVDLDNDVDFNTSEGDIVIAIDGDLDSGGHDLQITDDTDNQVRYYINGDWDLDNPTIGTVASSIDAERTQFYIDGGVAESTNGLGNAEIDAIIYAPNADLEANGNPRLRGSFVFNRVDLGGNSGMEYDPDLTGQHLTIAGGPGQNPITYLHVSENTVDLRFD